MMLLRTLIVASALLLAAPAFADSGMRVVVPNHDIARGATIAPSDLVYGTIPASNVFSGVATSMDELAGQQARRMLHAGEIVRVDDVRHPILVSKGSIVTMTFEAPGVVLTASGRAMSEGGMGDTVTVQNPTSFRQITAMVIGAGAVRAAGGAKSNPAGEHLAAATH
jgi:flagella basal body P-ring formation protein FlgA